MINGLSLTTAPRASFPTLEPIEVALLTSTPASHPSSDGTMLGVLSHIPGGILLNTTDMHAQFVEAYLLELDEGQAVADGDSGAWVVNPVSMEVYGHVVATDVTGDAYVVPLWRSLEEMRQRLGVEAVGLPETADLLDAALRAEAGVGVGNGDISGDGGGGGGVGAEGGGWYDGVGVGSRARVMMGDCGPRERRASEVFLLCDGWKLGDLKRSSLYRDVDSGYGSIGSTLGEGTPFDETDEDWFRYSGRAEEVDRSFF